MKNRPLPLRHRDVRFDPLFVIRRAEGHAVLLLMFVLAASGLIAATGIAGHTLQLLVVGKQYRSNNGNQNVQRELETVFTRPEICTNAVRVSGSTFTLANGLAVGAYTVGAGGSRALITAMTIENVTPLGGGMQSAEFAIQTSDGGGRALKRNSLRVRYRLGGGGILSECLRESDSRSACARMGMQWIENENRCSTCEFLGGTWRGGRCEV